MLVQFRRQVRAHPGGGKPFEAILLLCIQRPFDRVLLDPNLVDLVFIEKLFEPAVGNGRKCHERRDDVPNVNRDLVYRPARMPPIRRRARGLA